MSPAIEQLVSRYKSLPRQQQQGLMYGTPAAIAVVFFYLCWTVLGKLGPDPALKSMARSTGGIWTEIADLNGQIEEKERIVSRKPEIQRRLADLKEDIDDAEQRLPRAAEKAQMREVIDRLARDIPRDMGSVSIKSVRILEDATSTRTRKGGSLSTVTYQMELLGDLNGIIKYIDSIEKNTRYMAVNQISIRGGNLAIDNGSGKDVKSRMRLEPHTVKLDLVTYVYGSDSGKGNTP